MFVKIKRNERDCYINLDNVCMAQEAISGHANVLFCDSDAAMTLSPIEAHEFMRCLDAVHEKQWSEY